MLRRALFIFLLLSASAGAQRVTLTFRNCADVADKTIQGMSGVTYTRVDDSYWVVLDNSNRIVKFQIKLAADGSIQSCKILGEVKLIQQKDFEGIAFTSPARNSVFLSDESPAIAEYPLSDGRPIRLIDVPGVFKQVVANQGFESLSLSPDGKALWTANERALAIDGNLKVMAEPMFATTRCRLQRFTLDGESIKPSGQFLYRTSGVHDIGGQIGLCDLVALPDGRLLSLERSAGKNLSDFYSVRTRIFLIDTKDATDITGPPYDAGLPKDDQTTRPVDKLLLYDGFVCDRDGENLEGLCLGPQLGPDQWAVIGVVDSTDGPMQVSQSRVVAFVLNLKAPATRPTTTHATTGKASADQ
jgi:3-phytase/alkaline phosphatase D